MSLNCLNFDFSECSFSEKIMNAKDNKGESREGSGRVAIYKETGCTHCYTLECNYHSGKRINYIAPRFNKTNNCVESETAVTDTTSKLYSHWVSPPFNIDIFEDVGRASLAAFLDLIDDNPLSRIKLS